MQTATLDDLMALNDQLAALAKAGVPLDMGGEALGELDRTLETINAAVARRVARGASLEEALQTDDIVPRWYRCLVLSGLRSRNMDVALDASHRVGQSLDASRHLLSIALFYPLIVLGMAYLGMIGCSLWFVPRLEQTYEELRIEPGSGLAALQWVRDALPYWVAVPPIALLYFVWRYRGRSPGGRMGRGVARAFDWLPGPRRAIAEQRWARVAETLAALEGSGLPLQDALPLAMCASGDPLLADRARTMAAADVEAPKQSGRESIAQQFPPFFRWAIYDSEATVGRDRALAMAARVYRQSAQRRVDRSRIVAPMVVCVLLGGGTVLLYGLALFVPVTDMLRALAFSM